MRWELVLAATATAAAARPLATPSVSVDSALAATGAMREDGEAEEPGIGETEAEAEALPEPETPDEVLDEVAEDLLPLGAALSTAGTDAASELGAVEETAAAAAARLGAGRAELEARVLPGAALDGGALEGEEARVEMEELLGDLTASGALGERAARPLAAVALAGLGTAEACARYAPATRWQPQPPRCILRVPALLLACALVAAAQGLLWAACCRGRGRARGAVLRAELLDGDFRPVGVCALWGLKPRAVVEAVCCPGFLWAETMVRTRVLTEPVAYGLALLHGTAARLLEPLGLAFCVARVVGRGVMRERHCPEDKRAARAFLRAPGGPLGTALRDCALHTCCAPCAVAQEAAFAELKENAGRPQQDGGRPPDDAAAIPLVKALLERRAPDPW